MATDSALPNTKQETPTATPTAKPQYEAKDKENLGLGSQNPTPSLINTSTNTFTKPQPSLTEAKDDEAKTSKDSEDEPQDLSVPKRPKTAYFHFMGAVREETKQANPGVSVGELSKLIGAKWRGLQPMEKDKYDQIAREEKNAYTKRIQYLKEQGVDVRPASKQVEAKETDLTLPLARVRRLVKRDPEIKAVSKDAAICMTKATELFIAHLAKATLQKAATNGQKKSKTLDELSLHQSIHEGEDCFGFLSFDFDKPAVVKQRLSKLKMASNATKTPVVEAKNSIATFFNAKTAKSTK